MFAVLKANGIVNMIERVLTAAVCREMFPNVVDEAISGCLT
jgi:hypothetical protein